MFVNKIGKQHLDYGTNCQDFGLETQTTKMVCDGCSESIHSEVGAKLFCNEIANIISKTSSDFFGADELTEAFEYIMNMLHPENKGIIKDFLCFTILHVNETDTGFFLNHCGDGYVILQHLDGSITFEELDDGEYPKYLAYNYADKSKMIQYTEGVEFMTIGYSKSSYLNVGVASDGIRFILREPELLEEFKQLLQNRQTIKMKRFINRNQIIFKDDVTIVF